MAILWRVLALSWLGGIRSPALTGDILPGELLQPTAALARHAETESWIEVAEVFSSENEGAPAQTHSGPPNDE
jgi:hypothetical protein